MKFFHNKISNPLIGKRGYPDQYTTDPIGVVAIQGAAAIADIKQPTIKTDPRTTYSENNLGPITQSTHPDYQRELQNWEKWRTTYEGGERFLNLYLKKFSNRETAEDFQSRLLISPIPAFAKGGITEIKNSIFQRIAAVTRQGGPISYQEASKGRLGGVNQQGGTMAWFLGNQIIPELLIMKKVGVFVDMPPLPPNATLTDKGLKHPYLYSYKAEHIRNWVYANDENGCYLTTLLLRDHIHANDKLGLPTAETERYRLLRLSKRNTVIVQFFDCYGNPIDTTGTIMEIQYELNIPKIPFICYEISDSLLKDVANHQISLLNMGSSDISYILKANFPFYTEQTDNRTNNTYLKQAVPQAPTDPTNMTTFTPVSQTDNQEINVGATQGRRYPIGTDRPGFIAPPEGPLMASMAKQDQLKTEIRALLQLALNAITGPKMQSAESKSQDNQGLEAGLSYVGLELENGERQVGWFWSMWEGSKDLPTIKYPKKFQIQSDKDARDDAEQLAVQRDRIPSPTFQRQINKMIVDKLVSTSTTDDVIDKINSEIDNAPGAGSNFDEIASDVDRGLVSNATASKLRGYPDGEADKAATDHADRLARIAAAQSEGGINGVTDTTKDPQSNSQQKKQQQDPTNKPTTKPPVRGKGQP